MQKGKLLILTDEYNLNLRELESTLYDPKRLFLRDFSQNMQAQPMNNANLVPNHLMPAPPVYGSNAGYPHQRITNPSVRKRNIHPIKPVNELLAENSVRNSEYGDNISLFLNNN